MICSKSSMSLYRTTFRTSIFQLFSYSLAKINQGLTSTTQLTKSQFFMLSNVYYTIGSEDPWHAVEINDPQNPNSYLEVIVGAVHASDLYSLSPSDSLAMQNVKRNVINFLNRFK